MGYAVWADIEIARLPLKIQADEHRVAQAGPTYREDGFWSPSEVTLLDLCHPIQ
jgi:hypothetical protein